MITIFQKFYASFHWKEILLLALLLGGVTFLLVDRLYPLPTPKPWSPQIYDRHGTLLASYLSDDEQWRMPSRADEVSPEFLTALIEKEDRWFYHHPGVNPFALVRALWSNLSSGKRVSGASTLTMQVARLMEPRPRTWRSKCIELVRALQLEWHHSKSEILEMYLSYLPYGGNIQGVKAAAYLYFDRPPAKLSLAQAVTLAVIPNRPNSLRPDLHPDAARAARDKWLHHFQRDSIFPRDHIEAALQEPLKAQRYPLPPLAPHFCRRMVAHLDVPSNSNARKNSPAPVRPRVHIGSPSNSALQSPSSELTTTLDLPTQRLTEQLLANYIHRSRSKGISNGAVLVVHNATSEVLAYCGSADFHDARSGGQVDGVQAIRSPGSTLKPLVYALAFDQGLATPKTRLLDIPATWNGYSPDNYDGHFRGPVALAYALRHSLNTTAVQMLNQVGYDTFLDLCEQAGFRTLTQQREQLGLSVILGGCGVTLEELVKSFTCFPKGGKISPLKMILEKKSPSDFPQNPPSSTAPEISQPSLFSEAAAWLITDILSGIERPDLPNDFLAATNRSPIAWKTGTSYGRRDAWSIGYSPQFTVGVWIGNFDGQGVPDLSGSSLAVPLLFEIFQGLQKRVPKTEFQRPDDIWKRKVCAETGHLPSEHCHQIVEEYYIKSVSPRKVCDQNRVLYIAPDSSVQYCTGCLPPNNWTKANFPILPPDLTLWYESNHLPYPRPPQHHPGCQAIFTEPGPQIISPNPDFDYLLQTGSDQEILLQAASDAQVTRHYWYVNGTFLQSSHPGEKAFFRPSTPHCKVTCMDEKGRSSTVEIDVERY